MEDSIRQAALIMAQRGRGVALTGAGISAESGISTYRDAGGLWDRYGEGSTRGIMEVLMNRPREAEGILERLFDTLISARPNPGHLALARMEQDGVIAAVITQNIDNLHRRAGSRVVWELHGNVFRLRCMQCGAREPLSEEGFTALAGRLLEKVRISFDAMVEALPACRCSGAMRPDFVSFGEPVQDLDEAMKELSTCGWIIVVGTSGLVNPAASLPSLAVRRGAPLIEVNPHESGLSPVAAVALRGRAGVVLPRLAAAVMELRAHGTFRDG